MDSLVVHNVGLGQAQIKLEEINKRQKSVVVQDQTGNLKTFLKYKGCVIECSEYLVTSAFGNTSLQQFQDTVRMKLVAGLKVGYQTALNFEKLVDPSKTLSQLLEGAKYNDMKSLFDPNILKDKEFYKNKILTPEEDVDNFGNKGWFKHNDDFQLVLLFEGAGEDYKTALNHHGLDPNLFEVVIIN